MYIFTFVERETAKTIMLEQHRQTTAHPATEKKRQFLFPPKRIWIHTSRFPRTPWYANTVKDACALPCPDRDSLYFVVRTLHSRWIRFSPSPCSSKDVSPEAGSSRFSATHTKRYPPHALLLLPRTPRRPRPPSSGCRVDARIGDASRPKGPWMGVVKACES